MSGFVGHGRLQDAEWLMRACMIMNADLPPGVPEYTPETLLNRAYTQQSAEFESLLERIDPEGDIDPEIFPVLAYFSQSEGWPFDIIIAGFAALGIWLFLPNYAGVAKFTAYVLVGAFLAIQYLRSRRIRERAQTEMRRLGLDPNQDYPLTLRMLVKYRRKPVTIH